MVEALPVSYNWIFARFHPSLRRLTFFDEFLCRTFSCHYLGDTKDPVPPSGLHDKEGGLRSP